MRIFYWFIKVWPQRLFVCIDINLRRMIKWIIQKGHPIYHCGGQCVSVVFTVNCHWIFLREKYKDRLRNSKSQMISNLIFSFHSSHDSVHPADVLTTNHHNKAWQRVFKCCKSPQVSNFYLFQSSPNFYQSYLDRNVIFPVKFILKLESFNLNTGHTRTRSEIVIF